MDVDNDDNIDNNIDISKIKLHKSIDENDENDYNDNIIKKKENIGIMKSQKKKNK